MEGQLTVRLDSSFMQRILARFRVPGVSVAVIRDFALSEVGAWGVADAGTGMPVTTGTLFQAASISKPVAAMASLRAVEAGAFSLDQDIDTILTSWRLPDDGLARERPVTPRMLLSHTAGLGDELGFPGYAPTAPLPTIPQILDGLPPANTPPVRLTRPPATASLYSGGGVTIQQLALSDALGRPFAGIARALVLEPIGMTRSTFAQPLPPDMEAFAASVHDAEGRLMAARRHVYPEQAAAGLWSTPADLARFVVEVQTTLRGDPPRVLPRRLMQEMVTPVGDGRFGLGFEVARVGSERYFGHGGANHGFRCELAAHLTKGYGLVVMTNGDNGDKVINVVRDRVARDNGWIPDEEAR